MPKLTRSNALGISAIALLLGAIGPWVTVLGLVGFGPTNSLEVGLIVFGGIGLVILSAITRRYMRPVSIVVGIVVLAEAINTLSKTRNIEESEWVTPGWGLYLSILTAMFLIVSTFVIKATFMDEHKIRSVSVAHMDNEKETHA